MSPTRVRAVFFDLDETLLDHGAAARTAATALASRLGHADVQRALPLWFRLEEEWYGRYLAGELTYGEQRRGRVRAFAAAAGRRLDDGAADDAFGAYREWYEAAWRLFPDVAPCLDDLRGGDALVVGVITNGDHGSQLRKLERLCLTATVAVFVTSGEVGCAKPDGRIFAAACRRAGVDPTEAVMVGDRRDVDAEGARAAGLTGVWLDRSATAPDPTGASAGRDGEVQRISGLAELPPLLGRLGCSR